MVDDSPAPPSEAVASAGRGLRGRTDCKVRGGAVVSKRKGGGGWLLGRVLELTDERDDGQILPQQL